MAAQDASRQHRLQCGPVLINLGGGGGSGSPQRDSRIAVGPSASPSQLRSRPSRQRSACFGLVEADDEEAAHSAVEQRYLKVGGLTHDSYIALYTCTTAPECRRRGVLCCDIPGQDASVRSSGHGQQWQQWKLYGCLLMRGFNRLVFFCMQQRRLKSLLVLGCAGV